MKKRVEFPAYYRVRQHKDLITPQIDSLSEVTSVSFSLVASVPNNTAGHCTASWKLYNGS